MLEINALDIFILLAAGLSAFIFYKVGIVSISFLLMAPVLALYLGKNINLSLIPTLPNISSIAEWLLFAAAVVLAGVVITKILDAIMLGFINRLLGMLAGITATVLIVDYVVSLLYKIKPLHALRSDSIMLSYLNELFSK